MTKQVEFRLPTWALPALINGDFTGLTDEEERKVLEFTDECIQQYGNAWVILPSGDVEVFFSTWNDIDACKGGECVTAYVNTWVKLAKSVQA